MDHPRAAAGAVLLAALTAVPLAGIPAAAAAGAPPAAEADDIQVRVGAAGDEARAHGSVDYALTVANTGPEDLPDARIVQLLPEGLTDVEAGQDGEAGDGEVVWERGLPAGEAVELESSGTVGPDAGGRLATTVCVRPAPGGELVGCASDSIPVGPVSKAWIAAWTAAAAGALLLLAAGGRWLFRLYRRFREDGVRIEYVTGRVAIPEPPLALNRMPWRYRLQLLQAVPVAGARTAVGEPADEPAAAAAQGGGEAVEGAEAAPGRPDEKPQEGAEPQKSAEPEPVEAAAGEQGAGEAAAEKAEESAAGQEAGEAAAEAAEEAEGTGGDVPVEAAADAEQSTEGSEEERTGEEQDAEEERQAEEPATAGQKARAEGDGEDGAPAAGERTGEPAAGQDAPAEVGEAAARAAGTGGGPGESASAVPAPRGRRKGRKPWLRRRKPRTGPERGTPEQAAGDRPADSPAEPAAERDLAPAERD
ncbi:DUF11 domain-containing protein [Nocardiopsis composta]|uniref:DUF11 domain-containing protein n=1 Tax=Nocardiopsis composta TaxID=157465 RepID=A0A7W8VCV3_9ACTN|nr:DUF11 domain-containing protein [Nocardiopsis composta]MBB5431786.1 hypothetical protein [Nocardiopsis composta]